MSTTTHTGGCHCKAVRYSVTVDLTKPVIACNCSICQSTGTLLTFVPAGDFHLLSGEDALTDYQFGKKRLHHLFCKVCGLRSFARGEGPNGPMVAINARCLDDANLAALTVQQFDGRSR